MNKKEVIELVATRAGLTAKSAEDAIETMLQVIKEQLAQGKKVSVQDLGVFVPVPTKERTIIHPVTKKEIRVPDSIAVSFSPADSLKKAIS